MTVELFCLVLMTAFFLLAWLPLSIAKTNAWGVGYLMSNRDETGLSPLPEWGNRAGRAYENLKSNLPGFAFAILVLHAVGQFDAGTALAAQIYVAARLSHFAIYLAGWSAPRSIAWSVGLVANFYLLARAF